MSGRYQEFIFAGYEFEPTDQVLTLHYSLDDAVHFTELYRFKFPSVAYDAAALDRAFQILFFMAGVSYYKTYLPPKIVIRAGQIDQPTAALLSKTYQKGLGEFFFVNQLDPMTAVDFPVNSGQPSPLAHTGSGKLVAMGGGKDSLVSVELLRRAGVDITTWSVNHQPQLAPLVGRTGLPHLWVDRQWDPQLLELNQHGAMNGHVPISAIFAAVGTVAAILSGKHDIVMSNEQSANEPTLHYRGVTINHQYSKSQEFEQDYQGWLYANFGDSLRYFSLLRPLSELHIAEIFANLAFSKYKDVFCSCNRAFVHSQSKMSWCGVCAKCAFVFLALTPFVAQSELEKLWGGKNLLTDVGLVPIYKQLLGIDGDKPLDCVGEIQESRLAMLKAFELYPQLADDYTFELDPGYDYHRMSPDEIPSDIRKQVM